MGNAALSASCPGRLARASKGQLSAQLHNIFEHTKHTLQDLRAPMESVVTAARQNPVGLGKETLHAGASATRQAAGVFFSEIGKHLQGAGDHVVADALGGGVREAPPELAAGPPAQQPD